MLLSPVDGVVSRTFAGEGEICRKGVPCMQIIDSARGWWVEGFVQEKHADNVKVGAKARVEVVLGSDDWADAKVVAIGLTTSSLDPSALETATGIRNSDNQEMVWVKVQPEETVGHPLAGMSARAYIY